MSKMLAKKRWNLISKSYQEKTKISLEDVHYGPISLGELKLKLLGDLIGKDILEIARFPMLKQGFREIMTYGEKCLTSLFSRQESHNHD